MAEKVLDRSVSLNKSSIETSPSVVCRLNIPNFFTLPEYDGTVFESPNFEFTDGIWCFRFYSENTWQREVEDAEEDCYRRFRVDMVRLKSIIPEHKIFYAVILLDANDEMYDCRGSVTSVFREDENQDCLELFGNRDPSFDRRETLCLIIELFCGESIWTGGDSETETTRNEKNYNVTLRVLVTRKNISSLICSLKVPNFFTMPEYDGTKFESRTFTFANAAWCFRFSSDKRWKSGDEIRDKKVEFDVYMVRLDSEKPEQRIYYSITLLNKNDEEHETESRTRIFEEDKKDCWMSSFDNEKSNFDTRDSLTLIIRLFYGKSFEMDNLQLQNTTQRDIATSTVDDFDGDDKDEKNNESELKENGTQLAVEDFSSDEKDKKSNESKHKDSLIHVPEEHDCATDINHFLEERKGLDVTFVLETSNGKVEIFAHQLILATRSSYFADEFYGKERSKESKIIPLKDVRPKAFEDMIRYCYGCEPALRTTKETCTLIEVASEFKVISLVNLCRTFLRCARIEPENVFSVLAVSEKMEDKSLRDMCNKLLQEKTKEVMGSYELLDVTPSMVHIILSLPKLSLRSEYELMKWIFDWANVKVEQKNAREYLEKLLEKMNFLSLKIEEFAKLCEDNTDFFSSDEIASICLNITSPGIRKMPDWCGKDLRIRVYTGSNE